MAITDPFAMPEEDTRYRETNEMLLKRLGPITNTRAFTPSDYIDETILVRGFHCTGSGIIRVLLENDTSPMDLSVSAGGYYPYRIKRLYSSGLTASIVGLL